MKVHKKDDGMKTKLQWMKEGFRIKKGEEGLLLWVNQNCPFAAEYYRRNQVQRSSKSAKDYREYIRKQRHERYVVWKKKQPDLSVPADAFIRCSCPDYAGWSANYKPVGKAVMIIDTETTGLDRSWNSMIQLSWQVVDTANWEVLSCKNYYFCYPANLERVESEAIEVNGLTNERLEGLGTSNMRQSLYTLIKDIECCTLVVGHNLDFDAGFIVTAASIFDKRYNTGWSIELSRFFSNHGYCTMIGTTDLCKLPKPWITDDDDAEEDDPYKWPKLSELARFLKVNRKDLHLHNSTADVELTKRCFRKLVEIGHFHNFS